MDGHAEFIVASRHALTPEVVRVLGILEKWPGLSHREACRDLGAYRRAYDSSRRALASDALHLPRIQTLAIPRGTESLPARAYVPMVGGFPGPALLYFHGGGWTVGGLQSHDLLCRRLAKELGQTIVAVDYRLAPESPYPAALDDAWTALLWLQQHAAQFNIDPEQISVGGDSAGGNLAAVLALMARNAGGPPLQGQVLIYPCTDLQAESVSHRTYAGGFGMSRERYLWFIDNYLQNAAAVTDWTVSPLLAKDLRGLPPTVLLTAGLDVLHDEGAAYAARLREAGVPVSYLQYATMIHGFVGLGRYLPEADAAVSEIAIGLRSIVSPKPPVRS